MSWRARLSGLGAGVRTSILTARTALAPQPSRRVTHNAPDHRSTPRLCRAPGNPERAKRLAGHRHRLLGANGAAQRQDERGPRRLPIGPSRSRAPQVETQPDLGRRRRDEISDDFTCSTLGDPSRGRAQGDRIDEGCVVEAPTAEPHGAAREPRGSRGRSISGLASSLTVLCSRPGASAAAP